MHVEHVLTDAELEDVIEINLNDIDFTEGNEPRAFESELNRFYRFVCR